MPRFSNQKLSVGLEFRSEIGQQFMVKLGTILPDLKVCCLLRGQLITFDRAGMVYKIFNKLCPENLWNKFNLRSYHSRYNTRFCRNIQIPKYNLEYAKKGFSYSALRTWNEIPLSIRELPTLFHFKKQLKMYLMS